MRITCWTHLISLACISLPVNAYQCIHTCFAARCLVFVLSVLALTQRGKKYMHGSGGAFDPTWEEALASLGFTRLRLCPPCFGLAHISVPFHVLLCAPVPSSRTYCHCRLSPRRPVVRDDADLCAWGRRLVHNRVWQQGDGLMRLAGHTWRHWPVSSRPCDCRMSRPALNRVAWEADFDPMWEEARRLSHRQLFQKQLFHLQLCHTHTSFTHNSFTLIRNSFTYNLSEIIDPPPFPLSFLPCPYRLKPFLIIGMSCLVELSGRWFFCCLLHAHHPRVAERQTMHLTVGVTQGEPK